MSINFFVVALGGGEQTPRINVKQNTNVAFSFFICSVVAKEILEAPISKEDMALVIKAMAIVTGPCLEGYHFLFFYVYFVCVCLIFNLPCAYWSLIGDDFTSMGNETLLKDHFIHGVTKGMIALLPKGGAQQFFAYLITLLNITYKIFCQEPPTKVAINYGETTNWRSSTFSKFGVHPW